MSEPVTVLFVHGLGASNLSWRYLEENIRGVNNILYLEYDPNDKSKDVIQKGVELADASPYPVIIIGHSLGGVVAWHIAQRSSKVIKGMSVCSPFGGFSSISLFLPLLFVPSAIPNMLAELGRGRSFITKPQKTESRIPWLNIIGTKGLFGGQPNDSVLTVQNQREIKAVSIEMNFTHTEILNSSELLKEVNRYIKDR